MSLEITLLKLLPHFPGANELMSLHYGYQEQQESIREAIEQQPIQELQSYPLGSDGDGNTYIHFPQFCGQDLRIYRQAPFKYPQLDIDKPKLPDTPHSKVSWHSLMWVELGNKLKCIHSGIASLICKSIQQCYIVEGSVSQNHSSSDYS